MLELAIAKVKVAAGLKSPGVVPTLAYQRSMTADQLAQTNKTLEELRLKTFEAVDENQELEHLLAAQEKQLEVALGAAVEHQKLVSNEMLSRFAKLSRRLMFPLVLYTTGQCYLRN